VIVKAGREEEARAVTSIPDETYVFVGLEDDSEVPLPEVVKDALGLDMPANQLPSSGGFCVDSTVVQAAENGSLRGCGEAENIWAYNDEGVLWRAEDLVGEASQM
jgi:hypothetical protein